MKIERIVVKMRIFFYFSISTFHLLDIYKKKNVLMLVPAKKKLIRFNELANPKNEAICFPIAGHKKKVICSRKIII